VAENDEPKDGAQEAGAEGEGKAKGRRRRRGGRGRKRTSSDQPEVGTPEEAEAAERIAEEALAAAAASEPEAEPESGRPAVDLEAFGRPGPRRFGPAKLEDDDALAQAYADEIASGDAAPAPVEGEHVDEKTADEDRPMTEAYAPGSGRRERGRRGRDRDRDRKKKDGRDRQSQPPPQQPQEQRGRDHGKREHREHRDHRDQKPPPPPPHAHRERPRDAAPPRPLPRVPVSHTSPLLSAAFQVLAGLNDPRPVHARQIAAMAAKRRLVAGDPEDLWRPMRLALLGAARAEGGLRPRVRFHGGSLFTLAATRLDDELAKMEQSTTDRLSELEAATVGALGARLRALPLAALEGACRLYLDRAGWREVTRVKKNDQTETWYLAGTRPDGAQALVAVRAGAQPVDRRGVGELRAGVEAKGFAGSLLLACAPLGEEALAEAAQPGPPTELITGDALARAFADASVGVHRSWVPVSYLDVDFFAELTES
jgi:hypothetical protein